MGARFFAHCTADHVAADADVVLLDKAVDVGARNERHLLATYTGLTAGFEVIHGLLDRVMTCANVPPTVHIADLCTIVTKLLEGDSEPYILAVDAGQQQLSLIHI